MFYTSQSSLFLWYISSFASDIEMDFKEQLRLLVPNLLAPENLVVKQIHGNKITGKELVEYFKVLQYKVKKCVYKNIELGIYFVLL